jgi:beta-mannosidase
MTVDGAVLAEAEPELAADARTVALVEVPAGLVPAGPEEFLVADAADPCAQEPLRALHFPAADRDIPYPRPEFEVALAPEGVTVTARTLVRDLLLQADRLDPEAAADRGRVTLLPGERVTIGVRGWKTPDPETARTALYCVEPTR